MTYGKSVTLSRAASYQRNRNVVSLQASKTGLGPITNIVVIVLILCLLGLVYLTQVTKTNALGYKVSELTTQQENLNEEYASLELEAVRLQNLDRIKNSDVAKSLNDTQPTAYVTE
jgi:cell division protein FtsL